MVAPCDVVELGTFNVVDDLRPARWLTETMHSFAHNVGSLVPDTFAAYARVFHPAHNDGTPVRWAQIARVNHKIAHPQMQFTRLIGYESRYVSGYEDRQPGLFDEAPEVGVLPPATAGALAHILARHTTNADHCWFSLWHGYGDLDPALYGQPTFALPHREYHLAHGTVAAAAQTANTFRPRHLGMPLRRVGNHDVDGGLMVQLHAAYAGLQLTRPTRDMDMVLHIETGAATFGAIRHELERLGYALREPVDDGPVHRFIRGPRDTAAGLTAAAYEICAAA
jgi:hypothetical protein